ncbi:MAG TPA: flagellin, partial [Lentisphaeria bacterium]|nr:flagellin [Lentisphaeria bacterium]
NNDNNRISLAIGNVKGSVAAGLSLEFDYLDTAADAQSMLDTVDAAISTLASARGTIGASMNRLSYAAANLATTIENTQAAESVIRDVDMADEMTTFTKNEILVQAGTAMLAQANQAPQLMLTLLGR